jgi:hypothetical protein
MICEQHVLRMRASWGQDWLRSAIPMANSDLISHLFLVYHVKAKAKAVSVSIYAHPSTMVQQLP